MSDQFPTEGSNGSGDGRKHGRRKDGNPFKEGNTRDDGSYRVGKGRTSESTRFRKDDGRKRGKREPGSKNLATMWKKGLNRKHTINGMTMTAAEWVIESSIRRAISKSDRAAEKVLEAFERFVRERDPTLGMADNEIMNAWLAERLGEVEGSISRDEPPPGDPSDGSDDAPGDGGDHDDQ